MIGRSVKLNIGERMGDQNEYFTVSNPIPVLPIFHEWLVPEDIVLRYLS